MINVEMPHFAAYIQHVQHIVRFTMLKNKVSWEVSGNFDLPTFFDTLKCSELENGCFHFF